MSERRYDWFEYVERFMRFGDIADVRVHAQVRENDRDYPLLRLTTPGRRPLVVTAGFHGEEPAGPLTLLEHAPEIVAYAAERDVALWVYPCINPSGFEVGSRYNTSGEKPNNDFLRYEVGPGAWKGELLPGEAFDRCALYHGGPKETRAIRDELDRNAPLPYAALDIHQDRYLPEPHVYAYVMGDRAPYRPLMAASEAHASIARDYKADEAHTTGPFGMVIANDGSVTDYYWRRGVRYVATLETTTSNPPEACDAINLIWIKGFIDFVAALPDAARPGDGPGRAPIDPTALLQRPDERAA